MPWDNVARLSRGALREEEAFFIAVDGLGWTGGQGFNGFDEREDGSMANTAHRASDSNCFRALREDNKGDSVLRSCLKIINAGIKFVFTNAK